MTKWISPLKIPKGKSGEFELEVVTYPAMMKMNVVSMRTALFSGVQPEAVEFYEPVTFHYLKGEHGTMMSDVPEEQYDHIHVIKKCKGTVLIAGLGLGYIATMLSRKKSVERIVIVELEQDVINLVWEHIKTPKMRLIKSDIWKYFERHNEQFDYIYLDTWYGTGERELLDTVVPMRNSALRFLKPCRFPEKRILAWKESVMRGQIFSNLSMAIQFEDFWKQKSNMTPEELTQMKQGYGNHYYPFWNWVNKKKPLPEQAMAKARTFAQNYGSGKWRKEWMKYES